MLSLLTLLLCLSPEPVYVGLGLRETYVGVALVRREIHLNITWTLYERLE